MAEHKRPGSSRRGPSGTSPRPAAQRRVFSWVLPAPPWLWFASSEPRVPPNAHDNCCRCFTSRRSALGKTTRFVTQARLNVQGTVRRISCRGRRVHAWSRKGLLSLLILPLSAFPRLGTLLVTLEEAFLHNWFSVENLWYVTHTRARALMVATLIGSSSIKTDVGNFTSRLRVIATGAGHVLAAH